MLIGKTRTNQPVEGYQDAPVFEGEFEEKEGKISLDMDNKDCQLIYDKKPMVIGIKIPDEDAEGKFQIVYFTLAIDKKEVSDAVMYQLVMTDEEEQTITKLSLAFVDDGDDIKVLYGEEEQKTLPAVETTDEGKLLGVVVDDDIANIGLVNPPAGGTKLYKHVITASAMGNLNIVTTKSTPFTSWAGIAINGSFISAYFSGPTTLYTVVVVDSNGKAYGHISNGTLTNVEMGTFGSDSVTAL